MSDEPSAVELQPIWHAGEKALQERSGVADRMEEVGRRNVRDALPDRHRTFLSQLPFIVAGSVDPNGDPWATLITGAPGFIATPTPTRVEICAQPHQGDPADAGMRAGDAIGLLGIELNTRRRNRVNGIILSAWPETLRVEVEQSFGNCPRYIRLRDVDIIDAPRAPFARAIEESTGLDESARALVEAADTFFVASYAERDGRRHVDVSHRGGKCGFVRAGTDDTLTIPDFAGNLFFMTLGNIGLNGKAGLVFVDFETGDLLQMTGLAELVLSSAEISTFDGAERLWTFRPRRVVRRRGALALRPSPRDGLSPGLPVPADRHHATETAGPSGGKGLDVPAR